MPENFPLLELSQLPLEKVIEAADFADLIQLSQSSEAAHELIKSQKRLFSGHLINIHISKHHRSVEVCLNNTPIYQWSSYSIRNSFWDQNPQFFHLNLEKLNMRVCRTPKGHASAEPMYEDLLLLWVEFLKNFFNLKIGKFCVQMHEQYSQDYFSLNFEKLLMESSIFHVTRQFSIGHCAVSHEELKFLLDNCKTDNFICNGYPGRHFRYLGPIEFPKITISKARWVDEKVLENLTRNSCEITLIDPNITDNQINEFLRVWIDSDHLPKKFKSLHIVSLWDHHFANPQRFFKASILQGIQSSESQKPGLNDQFTEDGVRIPNPGWDFERKDGTVATVCFTTAEEEKKSEFHMRIWD